MKPKLLKSLEEKKALNLILKEFYSRRPDNYEELLTNRKNNIFSPYFDLITYHAKPGDRILELGAGTGWATIELSKKGFKTVGCDILSEQKLNEYKKNWAWANAELVAYDGINLPFADNSFDVVTSSCVFEHIIFVDDVLKEINRILKKGGLLIIRSPNWSGLNIPFRALESLIFKHERYWQYESILYAILSVFRSIFWYIRVLFAKQNELFITIYPRLKDGKIDFQRSDDDCVHLCQPLSFKKWFKTNNYNIIEYNRFRGDTKFAKIFNTIFPSFTTINHFVVRKK